MYYYYYCLGFRASDNFEWLKSYSESPESPDLAVFRHQIVRGADFIARDMAAKYHMQMKEKEYTYKQPYT